MKRILVTGTGGPAATNFIRSLRLAKEKIYIVGTDINKYYLHLSQADKTYLVHSCNHKDYFPYLNQIIKKEKIDFLHCQPDSELQVISKNRDKINCKVLLPSHNTIKLCWNKFTLNQHLDKAGVANPRSFYINDPNDIMHAFEVLGAKGHKKVWVRAIKGAGSRAALPVSTTWQANMWIDYWHDMKDVKWGQFMMSEFLPGKEYAFQSIWSKGRLITSMARERLAYVFGSRMPSGQSSSPTIAKTVHNEKVNKNAILAIQAVEKLPNGIYCVDLKENIHGEPCITEINAGRFFTTSIFFSTAGCNMPYYYLQTVFGERLPTLPQVNALPQGLYWIRQIDCPAVLVREDEL